MCVCVCVCVVLSFSWSHNQVNIIRSQTQHVCVCNFKIILNLSVWKQQHK